MLRLTLTTPSIEPVKGPVPVVIQFSSSTLLCNGANCTSNLTVNLFSNTTGEDLAALAIADPSIASVGDTVNLEAITYNNALTPTSTTTNTSVAITDASTDHYSVPQGLAPSIYPGPDGVHPDLPYVSRFYTYYCAYAHIASMEVHANFDGRMAESDYTNNDVIASIVCGEPSGCYDYM